MTPVSLRVDDWGNVLTPSGLKLGRVIRQRDTLNAKLLDIALGSGHDIQAIQVHGSHEVIVESYNQRPAPEPTPEPESKPVVQFIRHTPVKKHAPDFYGGWSEFRLALPREVIDRLLTAEEEEA